MGMFDSVLVPCPKCGAPMEFQSKAWNCQMDNYSLDDAPTAILWDIINEPQFHEKCGQWVALIDPQYPPGQRPRPNLKATKVSEPENPITHVQGFKWWPDDKEFTFDDLENKDDGTYGAAPTQDSEPRPAIFPAKWLRPEDEVK